MTDPSSSPLSTPKRTRTDFLADDSPSPLSAAFSFDVNGATAVPASGSSSPRTKVAHRFRGLALADHGPASGSASGPAAQAHGSGFGGGGVASAALIAHAHRDNDVAKPTYHAFERRMQVDENEAIMRKRTRISPNPDTAVAPRWPAEVARAQLQVPETPDVSDSQPPIAADPTSQDLPFAPLPSNNPPKSGAVGQLAFDQAIFSSSPRPSPSRLFTQALSAPSNRPVETVKSSKARKRAGTPTLAGTIAKASTVDQTADTTAEVIDPIRAALTWHEDEITVYDPEDEDDDGVGINGIGFKPTPAIAYARTMKRRQQLAEYKKREEREARARRNLRRRASTERVMPTRERQENAARKVHFTETEPSMMIETI